MFFLEIEKCMIFLSLFSFVGFKSVNREWGWEVTQLMNSQSYSRAAAACYRRSFPFRWIFKIFPSLCLAVAMPFFSRFAVERRRRQGMRRVETESRIKDKRLFFPQTKSLLNHQNKTIAKNCLQARTLTNSFSSSFSMPFP